jgi:hypothetical protein
VLREALKARASERGEHVRREAVEAERAFAELDAERERERVLREQEQALREKVRLQNEQICAAFGATYMGVEMAGKALGFRSYEARYRLRDLVGRGVLREFDGPREIRVEKSFEGLRAVETQWPLCAGGPFFLRDEILDLRHEAMAAATRDLQSTAEPDATDRLAAVLRLLLDRGS